MVELSHMKDIIKNWEMEHPYLFSFILSTMFTIFVLFYTPSITFDEESIEQSDRIHFINIEEVYVPQRVTKKEISENTDQPTDYSNVERAVGTAVENTAVDLAFMPNIAPPHPVGKLKKRYPEEARQMDVEATVNVQLLISENGRVKKVNVLGIRLSKSLPADKQKELIKKFARETVLILNGAAFTPPIINGKKVSVKYEMPLRFRLED